MRFTCARHSDARNSNIAAADELCGRAIMQPSRVLQVTVHAPAKIPVASKSSAMHHTCAGLSNMRSANFRQHHIVF
jgi:hypothetical protein